MLRRAAEICPHSQQASLVDVVSLAWLALVYGPDFQAIPQISFMSSHCSCRCHALQPWLCSSPTWIDTQKMVGKRCRTSLLQVGPPPKLSEVGLYCAASTPPLLRRVPVLPVRCQFECYPHNHKPCWTVDPLSGPVLIHELQITSVQRACA